MILFVNNNSGILFLLIAAAYEEILILYSPISTAISLDSYIENSMWLYSPIAHWPLGGE